MLVDGMNLVTCHAGRWDKPHDISGEENNSSRFSCEVIKVCWKLQNATQDTQKYSVYIYIVEK